MKLAIIGAGAAGSVFACYLKKGGADDITLVDLNQEHMEKVAADGMDFSNPDGEFHLTGFKTATRVDTIGVMDIVILMVKSTVTEKVLAADKACIGPDTVVCTLQNGLGNEENVRKVVPANRILYGCGNMGTELTRPGACLARPFPGQNMFFGALERNALTDRAGNYLETCFKAGGLNPKYYDDVRPLVWKKALSNSGYNTVCTVLRMKVKDVYDDPNGVKLVWDIWHEGSNVAEAMGIPGLWEIMQKEMEPTVRGLGYYYPSMTQDLQHKRQTEVDSLVGTLSRYGKQTGVPTPTCDVITTIIKAIQANYDKMF